MSIDNLVRFRDAITQSPQLQEEVARALSGDLEDVITLGNENGFEFDRDDLECIWNADRDGGELNDFELEVMTGDWTTLQSSDPPPREAESKDIELSEQESEALRQSMQHT